MGDRVDVEVVVVGGGLAGLAAAACAARSGASVVCCDGRAAGGRARSDEREGFVLNRGPHALYRSGAGVDVLGRLGVGFRGSPPHPVVSGYNEATCELSLLPTSAGSLLRSPALSLLDKVRLARVLTTLPKLQCASFVALSAAEWIASLGVGPRGAGVVSALTRLVTYAGDLDLVSADAAVAQLQLALEGNVVYLDGGWQSLVDGLVAAGASGGARFLAGERAAVLQAGTDGAFEVRTPVRTLQAASVVVASGGPAAARALLPHAPVWELGAPAAAACLDLGLRRVPATMVAYGLDQPLYLSTHCPKADLAPPGGALVHVMRYGARTSSEDRAQMWALARRCGIDECDVVVQRFLHEMTVCHALPRPGPGLTGRPAIDATGTEGVFLAGDWVGAAGLLADASLASGEAAGRAAAEHAMRRRVAGGAKVGR
ncbi:MAG: FAD-dependent oxidoreductase [Acidimicrobiales bacterium]